MDAEFLELLLDEYRCPHGCCHEEMCPECDTNFNDKETDDDEIPN